ncbi:carboxypeptidase B-like [Phymastichus coffea]|uniref:carboxypeptidase B-like n=1 Tax=Phymastichus coffea TaxID=108790 RepID=UPI00273A9A59|nr:carboxypeptidase B-like [Phymastichus coffea]
MRAIGVIFVSFAVLTFAQDEYQPSIYGMKGFRIKTDTSEQRDYISNLEGQPGFDFLKLPRNPDSPIEILVAPEQLDSFKDFLNKKNIKYKVFLEDVSKVIERNLVLQKRAHRLRSNDILKAFPRYNEIVSYLKRIAKQYSNIAELFSIGKSYEGRDLLGIKISNGTGNKPVVVIDAGIHAREWIAPTTALYAIDQLVKNTANHYLFQDVDIYIIPSINPDGYEYSHRNAFSRLWRKTRSNHSTNVRCRGVDANRNFDISWMSTGASSNPCSDTYAGPSAFSEPETIALRDFLLSLKGRIRTYITLHSYGQYLLYPWAFTSTPPKAEKHLKCVAHAAAAAIYKHQQHEYTIGNTIEVLYPASGSSMDWAMSEADAGITYAVELPGGRYGFAPPPKNIIPVGRETFDALAIFIRYASIGDQVC